MFIRFTKNYKDFVRGLLIATFCTIISILMIKGVFDVIIYLLIFISITICLGVILKEIIATTKTEEIYEKKQIDLENKTQNIKKSKKKATAITLVSITMSIFAISFVLSEKMEYRDSRMPPPENPEIIKLRNFNSNFTPYEGENRLASEVQTLILAVEDSNEKATEDGHQVEVIYGKNGKPLIKEMLDEQKRYKVSLEVGDDHYINKIIVEIDGINT